jgi:CHAT domain-containing protein
LNFVFAFSSNESRKNYVSKFQNTLNGYKAMTFNAFNTNKAYSCNEYNIELYSNSLLLNTSRNIQQTILNSKDTSLISTFGEFKNLRGQINYLQQQLLEKQKGLPELEEKANQLDKHLTKASQAYQQNKENLNIQWQDVQKGLKVGEAAIQFISFPYYNRTWTDSILYCALVVKPGMVYPAMIPLFEQKQLDSLLVKSYSSPDVLYASRGTKLSYSNLSTSITQSGNELYSLIWKPIEKELNGVKRVYYSPSGTLHQIAFAALPIDSTQLLSDRYDLYQLTSTRQIATSEWKNQPESITSASLFGGITYDMDERELNKFKPDSINDLFSSLRSFTTDSSQRSTSFNFLAGSNEEVKTIASQFEEKNIPVSLNSGINGDEATFKNLSNQDISVLHIATHGFFFPIEREKPTDFDRLQFRGEQKFRYVPNPLLRSGLILAGGNQTWKGEEPIPGIEDGILTAQEISEMNLFNTDLVVLSACETGLGDIKGGEGVFGLQRAFKLAGVNTIIMSLWKVPDLQTSMLMQSFYSKWLNGMSKHDAFREAQKEVRQVYPGAYYWAGFVMVD